MTMQANELIEIRKALGMTQSALADELGVSRKTIMRMEDGGEIDRRTELAVRYLAAVHDDDDEPAVDTLNYRPATEEDIAAVRAGQQRELLNMEADLNRIRKAIRRIASQTPENDR
ncbi:helix-turn-helix domain-containing protein [Sphingomonas colocasiae]|uniref:Helix-turn-helix domain-containing protein n=2 Tax=Sphingomonas colocasiae TaxID=1848973 RepID=A0ABS7PXP8_9SPHN|nr:helix-turn-helix domain-containing protein [Sphingomonas colocasiae]